MQYPCIYLVMAVLLLTACSKPPIDVIGKWRDADDGSIYEFLNDGTFTETPRIDLTGKNIVLPESGKYSFSSDGRFKLEISGFNVVVLDQIALKKKSLP